MHYRLLRVLAVAVVVTAGCSSDRASPAVETVSGIPVLEGATRPVGSRLRNGFTVAPGTVLIGDVFPIGVKGVVNGRHIEDNGWHAHLLVTGDPQGVIRHYQQEAADVGLYLNAGRLWRLPPTPPNVGTFCGEAEFEGYLCAAFAYGRSGSEVRSFLLQVRRQPRGGNPATPLSFASMTFSTIEAGPPSNRVAVELGPPAPSLPTDWPPLAEPGGWIPTTPGGFSGSSGASVPPGYASRIRVQAGSRDAAPAFANPDCTAVGARAVLLIEGDVRDVLMAYRREFLRLLQGREGDSPGPRGVERRRDDGAEVFHVQANGHDSGYKLTAFVRDGRPTWGLIEVCQGAS